MPGIRAQGGREPGLALTRAQPVSSASSGGGEGSAGGAKTAAFSSSAVLVWVGVEGKNTVPRGH